MATTFTKETKPTTTFFKEGTSGTAGVYNTARYNIDTYGPTSGTRVRPVTTFTKETKP